MKPAQGLGAGLFAGVTNVSMDQECSKHMYLLILINSMYSINHILIFYHIFFIEIQKVRFDLGGCIYAAFAISFLGQVTISYKV